MSESTDVQPTPAQPAPQQAPVNDRGFPEGVPIAEMTDAQRANYWQHYARKHENTVKEFKGITPQQAAEMQSQLEALQAEKLTADEKALKSAREEAAAAAQAEFLPKLQAAEVKSIAAEIIKGDQLATFMSIANPSAFVGENGAIDESKVMGALTAMFGQAPQPQQPRWQNAGQFTPPPPPSRPGEGGRAEAARRFGTQSK